VSPVPTIRAELSGLARLAVPLALASAGQAAMGVVDTAVAGRAGAVTLAGTGLGNGLFFAVAVLGFGIMMGLDPLVAQAMGAGDRDRARAFLWQGVWMALGAGAALAAPLTLLPWLLGPLGVEPEVARSAGAYLLWRLPGLPALLYFVAARAYLQGISRTRPLVIAVLLANVLNLGLDVLLVFGGAALPAWTGPLRALPALGAAGASIATTLVTWAQAGLLSLAARPERGAAPVRRRPDRAALGQALRVGLPIGLHMAAEVGLFGLAGLLAGRLGAVPLGAHQIALSLATLSFTVAVGVANAAGVRVGWAVGAGDTPAARRAGLVAFGAGAGFMTLSALTFVLAPGALAALLTSDPEVLALAPALLLVAALFQVADGVQAVGAGVLRGAGDTRYTFAANMVGHWLVGLPVALLLLGPGGQGVVGIWWGLCAGLVAVAAGLLLRFLRISSRPIAPLAAGSLS
jgi:MATE family multidrug resistance protein